MTVTRTQRPRGSGTPPARAIRIPDELWESARAVAAARGEQLPEVIRRALAGYVRQAISERVAAAGLSDREFARQLGVSHNWVHRHLRAEPPAPFAVADVERIAAALGVPISQLLPTEPAGRP